MKDSELYGIYVKYKAYLIPGTFIFLSIFMLFRIILPQFTSIGDQNTSIATKSEEIVTLNESLSSLSNQNEATLEEDVALATQALPTSKDVALIFSALSSAASDTGVELRDFSLEVGGVYGRAERVNSEAGVPTVDVVARVESSNAQNIINFAQEIKKTLPLADVTEIDSNGGLATYKISFFYKPQDLSLVARQDSVPPLGRDSIELLNQLREWE